jgi:uncharacterized membrane protein
LSKRGGVMEIPLKLKSRKLWCAVIYAVLVLMNNLLKLGLTEEQLWQIALAICTYIIGQSVVDSLKVFLKK